MTESEAERVQLGDFLACPEFEFAGQVIAIQSKGDCHANLPLFVLRSISGKQDTFSYKLLFSSEQLKYPNKKTDKENNMEEIIAELKGIKDRLNNIQDQLDLRFNPIIDEEENSEEGSVARADRLMDVLENLDTAEACLRDAIRGIRRERNG